MLKNLDEFKKIPFVSDVLHVYLTTGKLKLFVSNLNEFLKDTDFREKFGFDREAYTLKEGLDLVRYLTIEKTPEESKEDLDRVFKNQLFKKYKLSLKDKSNATHGIFGIDNRIILIRNGEFSKKGSQGEIIFLDFDSLVGVFRKQPPVTDGWHFWISLRSLTISVV